MNLHSYLPSDAWNFQMAARFLENLWTADRVHPKLAKELVLKNRTLLGRYAASDGNFLPTFRYNLFVPSSRFEPWRWDPVAYRVLGGFGGVRPPHPRNSEGPPKSCQTTRLWKLLKIAVFRTPTPQDIREKGSKIIKLPPVRNCFTSAMTNKLVVIINILKVPKIKEILLYEMKYVLPNYSCIQNPVLSVLNWICWSWLSFISNVWIRTKFSGKTSAKL